MRTSSAIVRLDGREPTSDELARLAFAGDAHFTAMQVRDGRVRGLDLHLDRLRLASIELFGRTLPDDQMRSYLRTALREAPADVSLTATVFADGGLHVLVRTRPPAAAPAGPLALAPVEYERFLPAIKHVGEIAKSQLRRDAVAQGFNDAVFVDRRGRLSEATIWNAAFWDGTAVVWPRAQMLIGTTMAVLSRQLERLGVPQRTQEITLADIPDLTGAAVMNSWTPGVAVCRIGDTPLPTAPSFISALHEAYQAEIPTSP